jgi:zinc transporter, ZIP family
MSAALVASAASGLATSLGALPFVFVRALPRRVYDGVLGLGAGLMLAAATLGLLAEALHGVHQGGVLDLGRLGLIMLGFATGVALAATMDRFIPHHHAGGHHQHLGHAPGHDVHDRPAVAHGEEARRGLAVVGALTLHRIPEGLAIGAGFAVPGSSRLGLLLAIAVGVQNACEGLVMAAPLRQGGLSARSGFIIVASTGLTIPAAAVLGESLAGLAAQTMPFILALAGGTLIYITSNEIIPESHSHGYEGTASAGVVLGFFVTMVLQAVLHG